MELEYKSVASEGKLTEEDFYLYLVKKDIDKIVQEIIINPFEEALKERKREKFGFENFSVAKKEEKRQSTSWKKVYDKIFSFLEIRADDSRAKGMEGLRKIGGIGYCIAIDNFLTEIEKQTKENTSFSTFPKLYWPRPKKEEQLPQKIIFPRRDYSKITEENAKICLEAKRFCSGFGKELIEGYYKNNRQWFKEKTGFIWYAKEEKPKDKGILPSREESPIDREREICKGKQIYVLLARKEDPDYEVIISTVAEDLKRLKEGEVIDYLRNPQTLRDHVNITSLLKRINLNDIREEKKLFSRFYRVSGKYAISPS